VRTHFIAIPLSSIIDRDEGGLEGPRERVPCLARQVTARLEGKQGSLESFALSDSFQSKQMHVHRYLLRTGECYCRFSSDWT
jgi:hypothetical protein